METVEKIMSIYSSMDLSELAVEAVTAAKDSQRQLTSSVQNAIAAGRYLTAAKSKVEHGQWSSWVSEHWEGDGRTARTAQRYMSLSNFDGDLSKVESLRDALNIVADAKNDTRVVFDEKPVTSLTPITPETIDKATPIASVDHPGDDDPSPSPPSTTVHSAASRKQPEAEKPRTQPVQPAPAESAYSLTELKMALSNVQKTISEEKQKKQVAKELRKTANKLDPPSKFQPPSVQDVADYCKERGNGIDAEAFVAWGKQNGWKLSNGNPMKDWQSAIITWEKRDRKEGKSSARVHGMDWSEYE